MQVQWEDTPLCQEGTILHCLNTNPAPPGRDRPWLFSASSLIRGESGQQLSTVLPQERGESCKP